MCAAASTLEERDSAYDLASAMMTTDRYAKVARATTASGASVVGVVKGAGMIEPELCATMLCFFLTDALVDDLQDTLDDVCRRSLSSVGVDGDESTSDMAVALASDVIPTSTDDFHDALGAVAAQLAHHLVRNGEGTNHVVRLALVSEDLHPDVERAIARDVLNGPLLKCAVAGNDPNVGRLVGKLGQVLGKRAADVPRDLLDHATVALGGDVIFDHGNFQLDAEKELRLKAHLEAAMLGPPDLGLPGKSSGDDYPAHGRCVEIHVDLRPRDRRSAISRPPTVVLGSDLTHQYVTENADYRS